MSTVLVPGVRELIEILSTGVQKTLEIPDSLERERLQTSNMYMLV